MIPSVLSRPLNTLANPLIKPMIRSFVSAAQLKTASGPVPTDLSSSDLDASIVAAARIPQIGVSLVDLQRFGEAAESDMEHTLLGASRFLMKELPIRFAHRIVELEQLPYDMDRMPSVLRVRDWYKASFHEINNYPEPTTLEEEAEFARFLHSIYERHGPTLVTMARAVWELKAHRGRRSRADSAAMEQRIYRYLDRFYTSRIGIRTLIAQHIALREPREGYVGIINTKTSAHDIAQRAIDDARFMCERTYGEAPEVEIFGDKNFTFPYIPSHLEHMLFELMKNSLRAVVEHHGADNALPTVKMIVSAGSDNEDVVIKISDEGGGIPRSGLARVWSYFYTTYDNANSQFNGSGDEAYDFSVDTPLAGLGYGLPLSRLFARYFGGDLQILSMEGYGTDAYLHLKNVGDAQEPVQDVQSD